MEMDKNTETEQIAIGGETQKHIVKLTERHLLKNLKHYKKNKNQNEKKSNIRK